MDVIQNQYLKLSRMRGYLLDGRANFLDLVHILNRNHICYQPGCTTCGCMGYRTFLREQLGPEGIAKMMHSVTREQILAQHDLDWHDAMEVLLVDNSSMLFEDSFIYKAYLYVWDEYRRLHHREHLKPWSARLAVLDALQSFDPQPLN